LESTPLPVHLVEPELNENLMHGNTEGIEVAAKWKLTKRWTLSPGYAFEEIHMHPALASHDMTSGVSLEHNAPRHSAQLRSQLDLVHGFGWNNSIYFVDSLTDQGLMVMSEVPAYTRLDSELSWKIGKQFSISVVGQNLLQDHHLEFLGTLGGIQSSEMKRSAYIKFVWTLR
jgi:iron complex outermembrane receptor protein